MPDPLAGWVQVTTDIPGHLGTALGLYKHDSGARLALFDGWSSSDKTERQVWWFELHYRRIVRKHKVERFKPLGPPFRWANSEIASVESM